MLLDSKLDPYREVRRKPVTRPEPADAGDFADQLRCGERSDPVDPPKVRRCDLGPALELGPQFVDVQGELAIRSTRSAATPAITEPRLASRRAAMS